MFKISPLADTYACSRLRYSVSQRCQWLFTARPHCVSLFCPDEGRYDRAVFSFW